jgi:hypothetical protein
MKYVWLYILVSLPLSASVDQRNEVTFQRGPYVQEFFKNFYKPWTHQAAIHAAHGGAHDLAHTVQPNDRLREDKKFRDRMVELTLSETSKNGPKSETYGPLTAQFAFDLFRTIDWTHIHHEQTYDIMSDKDISPDEKQKWNDRSVKFYLENFDIPRSIAPLEVTMRRAGVMMKPYFTHFRNYFPETNLFFWVAHWWHPAIYEAQYIGMSDGTQKDKVSQADGLINEFFKDPPKRMILSRELMPRYTKMNPASANIFDNLHMLHGIAYDILTYPKWSAEEKRKELYRVIEAMKYRKGDEKYLRAFAIDRPDTDPTIKEPWMVSQDGAMNSIMKEMIDEMMPMMMPGISESKKKEVMEQFRMKMGPRMEAGEHEGSLHDALMKVYPDMVMTEESKESMKPGKVSKMMVKMMLSKWEKKNGF